jgi:Spy/CpxP family protein refolding chaperone
MPPSRRIRLAGALTLSILGVLSGLAAAHWTSAGLFPQDGGLDSLPADATGVLGGLELSPMQRAQIEELRARERSRIEGLQCALAQSERDLRSAEMEQPFDAERVNDLVSGQAELIGYLRGTESRVIGEIARLLSPEQERRFSELRTSGPDASRSSVLSSLQPPAASCPTPRITVPELPARLAPSRPEPAPRTPPRRPLLAAAAR